MEENEFRILFYFFLPLRRNFSIISRSDPFQFILSAPRTVRYFSFFSFFRVSRNENRRFEKIKMLEFLFSREIREWWKRQGMLFSEIFLFLTRVLSREFFFSSNRSNFEKCMLEIFSRQRKRRYSNEEHFFKEFLISRICQRDR